MRAPEARGRRVQSSLLFLGPFLSTVISCPVRAAFAAASFCLDAAAGICRSLLGENRLAVSSFFVFKTNFKLRCLIVSVFKKVHALLSVIFFFKL